MPNDNIIQMAKRVGKEKDAEDYWDKAKSIVNKEYGDIERDTEQYYALVMGVYKKMLGMKEGQAINTTTSTNISNFPTHKTGFGKKKRGYKDFYYGS
jgi:hypothetical protein